LELRGSNGDWSPLLMSAYLYAAKGQREKISPEVFAIRPEQVVDGDLSYYVGGTYALLGEKQNALRWLRRAVELGNHNYPWFSRDKNWRALHGDPQYERIMSDIRARWESYKKEFGIS
jgi:serine/threonine-protein kinase